MPTTGQPFLLVIEPSLTVRTVIEATLCRNARAPSSFHLPYWALFADPVSALGALHASQIPVPHIGLVCRDLPHLDGYQVIQHVHQRGYPTSFIVLLSAEQDSPLERIKAHLAGARTTLAKPFTVQQLLQTLASTLS